MGAVFSLQTATCCIGALLIRSFMLYLVCHFHLSWQLSDVTFEGVHRNLSGGHGLSYHIGTEAILMVSPSVKTKEEPLFQMIISLDTNSEVIVPL